MRLRWAKLLRLPIAHTLRLAHTLSEEDRVDLLQAELADTVAAAELLELDEGAWGEGFTTREGGDVIAQAKPYLDDRWIFEQGDKALRQAHLIEAEEEALLFGSYLKEGDLIANASCEAWARLGVNTEDASTTQAHRDTTCLFAGLYDGDGSGAACQGKRLQLLVRDRRGIRVDRSEGRGLGARAAYRALLLLGRCLLDSGALFRSGGRRGLLRRLLPRRTLRARLCRHPVSVTGRCRYDEGL